MVERRIEAIATGGGWFRTPDLRLIDGYGPVNSIFMKPNLPPAPDDNRRSLAVLAYLQG